MTSAEAIRLIAVLASYFRQEVSDETAVLWSKDLVSFYLDDGLEAAELAGKTQVYMPNLAEFLALIRDVRNTRIVMDRLELPSNVPDCCKDQPFAHWYQTHADDDMKARVQALLVVPPRARPETIVIREAFARVVGGKS
jgi:hypothetical protein